MHARVSPVPTSRKVLGWTAFGSALLAGVAFAAGGIGWVIHGMLASVGLPGLVGAGALVAGVLVAADLLDRLPGRTAVWGSLLAPSLARGTEGQLGDAATQAIDQIMADIAPGISGWLGVTGALAVGLLAATVALLLARRLPRSGHITPNQPVPPATGRNVSHGSTTQQSNRPGR